MIRDALCLLAWSSATLLWAVLVVLMGLRMGHGNIAFFLALALVVGGAKLGLEFFQTKDHAPSE